MTQRKQTVLICLIVCIAVAFVSACITVGVIITDGPPPSCAKHGGYDSTLTQEGDGQSLVILCFDGTVVKP